MIHTAYEVFQQKFLQGAVIRGLMWYLVDELSFGHVYKWLKSKYEYEIDFSLMTHTFIKNKIEVYYYYNKYVSTTFSGLQMLCLRFQRTSFGWYSVFTVCHEHDNTFKALPV